MTPPSRPAGATWLGEAGTRFRVWAPAARRVDLILETPGAQALELTAGPDGWFEIVDQRARPGTLYSYQLDGRGPYPDPASRFQPQGVHGPSEVIDPASFTWSDDSWKGLSLGGLILYELHVGTFTPEGTFRALRDRLGDLVDLGITAIQLMPVAASPGLRNWGYDGVAPSAPSRAYGRPDDLRALVNEAHRLGLAVHLDVVYNHFGPDGAYQGTFSPYYYSSTHRTPWGAAINFDGPGSVPVREYVVQSAAGWIREYHLDGLRIDATHAIVDDSPRSILSELAETARLAGRAQGREVVVIAEDARNIAAMIRPEAEGGWGLDAVWSDDFHHQLGRRLAGDADGYYADFTGSTGDIAVTARDGWFFQGQYSRYFGRTRGTPPTGIPARRFVFFLQNHDQVGNRALGERLHHRVSPAAWRAASTLLLVLPETPLLFMGQEWAASSPFLYFTHHHPELGEKVAEGRRHEFARFESFRDPAMQARIPDPQATETFTASQLHWDERKHSPHREVLNLYRRLVALRREAAALQADGPGSFAIEPLGEDTILVRREAPGPGAEIILAIVRLSGSGRVELPAHPLASLSQGRLWELLLTTGDRSYGAETRAIEFDPVVPAVDFPEPGAILLSASPVGD